MNLQVNFVYVCTCFMLKTKLIWAWEAISCIKTGNKRATDFIRKNDDNRPLKDEFEMKGQKCK